MNVCGRVRVFVANTSKRCIGLSRICDEFGSSRGVKVRRSGGELLINKTSCFQLAFVFCRH